MSKALIAFADRLARRMESAPTSARGGKTRYTTLKTFRPDIAEAIASGEYEFMQLNNRKSSFRWRSILRQVQQETRSR